MKILPPIQDPKLGITWLTCHGTQGELDAAGRWIHANKTIWVMEGKVVNDWTHSETHSRLSIWTRISMPASQVPRKQMFGFKSANDALRFKLSMSR